jgi:hypothetical protein
LQLYMAQAGTAHCRNRDDEHTANDPQCMLQLCRVQAGPASL